MQPQFVNSNQSAGVLQQPQFRSASSIAPGTSLEQHRPPYQQTQPFRAVSSSSTTHEDPSSPSQCGSTATENIRVVVRIRPLSRDERSRGDLEIVHCEDDGQTVRWIEEGSCRNVRAASDRGQGFASMRCLTFDSCLTGSNQNDVFVRTRANQLLQDAIDGYAVTIFAYGQTGSGKTYTMTGPDLHQQKECTPPSPSTLDGPQGLIPRALACLFNLLTEQPRGALVRASYLEIYNETLNDLLNPASTNLLLRYETKRGPFVQNLLQVDCESLEDAMLVLAEGTRNKKVASHQMNKDSSRSHCLMTLYLMGTEEGKSGRISLVDLAGSERLKDSGSEGAMASETGHINRSLFALGNVISALADPRKRHGHIPYRDSKLTRLLMDSLGGDSRTLMLACVSPSSRSLEETVNTLLFASRAKNIQNRPAIQVDTQSMQLQQLQATVRMLQEENEGLGRQLARALVERTSSMLSSSDSPTRQNASAENTTQVNVVTDTNVGACASRGASCSRGDQHELAALRLENTRLRNTSDTLRRSNELLQTQVDQLQLKLQRLETVFDNM